MYAVEVMPIQRGAFKGSLTFFSRDSVAVGSVVSAPIRKRMVPSLVMSCTDAREQKLNLKVSDFALKKLGTATPRQLFTPAFMSALSTLTRFHATTEGAALAQLTFAQLIASPRSLATPKSVTTDGAKQKPEVLVLQAERNDRVLAYKNLVRECFARQHSVLIIAPTLVEVEELYEALRRGIDERVVVVTSTLGARALRTAWDKVATAKESLLLIGTPAALSLPIQSLDVVVLERESARSYVARTRPSVDLRRAAELCAQAYGARCILADFPVRIETFARLRDGTADDMARPQVRTQSLARTTVLDVRTSDATRDDRRHFSALQPSTYATLEKTLQAGGRAIVFAARRGIAPLTVCNDCGTPITDTTTDTPMVLHKTPKGNVFMSHRSGAVEPAERSCTHCGGWNLVSLGIGVDRVYDELKKHFPKATLISFTADTAPTHKAAQKLIADFYASDNALLVGTERMLPYVSRGAEAVVVASIDSILSLSAWRAHEHALTILFGLLYRAQEEFVVETRRPESAVMKSIASGTPMEFLRDELKERHAYGYPPFTSFIGLEWSGTELHCAKHKALVVELFKNYDLVGPLPPEARDKTRFVQRAVVRLSKSDWPNEALSELLDSLPITITLTVDPDDIV